MRDALIRKDWPSENIIKRRFLAAPIICAEIVYYCPSPLSTLVLKIADNLKFRGMGIFFNYAHAH